MVAQRKSGTVEAKIPVAVQVAFSPRQLVYELMF